MPVLETQVQEYLGETLGVRLHTMAWHQAERHPPYLANRYRFAEADVFGSPLLLMLDESVEQESPAALRKHITKVQERSSAPVVYVRDQMSSYNRKRLIEQRVQFIIPGNQMYLPELGIDLREYFRKPAAAKQKFRPATQAVFLFLLLNRGKCNPVASAIAPKLAYSSMTLSRAFDELESVELAESTSSSRERVLHFVSPSRETWERAQPWLIDPVSFRKRIAYWNEDRPGLHSGMDALAHYSMIAQPKSHCFAIGQKRWKELNRDSTRLLLSEPDTDSVEIEVWKYAPRSYHDRGTVDPLSLYLSLRDNPDERVSQALDQLVEQMPW
jgi:DNA-binding MarR family transcriptional regulator